MKFTDQWNELTEMMGYWVDLNDPYVTYKNDYIESLWFLLKKLYDKGLLYKGYTIQPYSPAAGTGLSSHELNQPGTYKEIKDVSIVAQFKVRRNEKSGGLFQMVEDFEWYEKIDDIFILAWTTTPWTLPSNSALTVNGNLDYVIIPLTNKYTEKRLFGVMARDLVSNVLSHQEIETLFVVDYLRGTHLGGKEKFDGVIVVNEKEVFIEMQI